MATVIAASIAAVVAILGWFIGSYLIARREDRTKRLQLTMEHSEKQIGEFYAPLLGLLEQLDATFRVKERMISQEPDNAETISRITYKDYFLPLHREIGEILKHKIHLLEGNIIPESVMAYFDHFTSENIYWRLTEETKIKTSVKVTDFPSEFYDDIKANLNSVIERYESAVQELRHGFAIGLGRTLHKSEFVKMDRRANESEFGA
jgi:hypothetical protein